MTTTTNTNILPFIENLEQTLLSAFLQDRKLWVTMYDHINPSYFRNEFHGKIFKIFKVYFNKYKELPTKEQVLNLSFRGGFYNDVETLIHKIYAVQNTLQQHEIEYLYQECNKFIKEQKIKDAILKSVDLLQNNKYHEIEEIIKHAVQWNNDIKLGTLINDAATRYTQLEELYSNIIPWPWQRLQALSEGMLQKQLYIVISSSSVGKSIFLDNVAFYSWFHLHKNVVSITMELSELKKCQRMDAYGLQIPMKELRLNKEKIIKFYETNQRKNRLFVKEFPTMGATVEKDFKAYLYNLELYAGLHPEDIDLIVVDYGDIVRPRRFTGNMYMDSGSVFESLRALAIEYNCPVLTASQTNRSVSKESMTAEEVTEGVLADSFKKLMIADWMLALVNTPEERARGIINFKILKDREGQKDVIIPMKIEYPQLRIYDVFDTKGE